MYLRFPPLVFLTFLFASCSSLPPAEGYAAFQEDSSADEAESPSKMKRSKGIHVFKKPSFSKKKEKDFKVKEKGPKEPKEKEKGPKEPKEKKEDKDKEKEKKSKDLTAADVVKQWKEKKKKKKPVEAEPAPLLVEAPAFRPVFGAPLAEAVKRTALYDCIQLPAVFRECVDYIESYGMKCEGIYRVSGMETSLFCSSMIDDWQWQTDSPLYLC